MCLGAQSTMRRAQVEGFTQQVEKDRELVVECYGLLTGAMGGVIVCQSL